MLASLMMFVDCAELERQLVQGAEVEVARVTETGHRVEWLQRTKVGSDHTAKRSWVRT